MTGRNPGDIRNSLSSDYECSLASIWQMKLRTESGRLSVEQLGGEDVPIVFLSTMERHRMNSSDVVK